MCYLIYKWFYFQTFWLIISHLYRFVFIIVHKHVILLFNYKIYLLTYLIIERFQNPVLPLAAIMHYQSAYFIQYQTFSCPSCSPSHSRVKGLSTVIVFADDKAQALARAGRLISKSNHQISYFQRMQILHEKNQQMFGEVLKSLYGRAELYGAALHFDPFPQKPHCCRRAL